MCDGIRRRGRFEVRQRDRGGEDADGDGGGVNREFLNLSLFALALGKTALYWFWPGFVFYAAHSWAKALRVPARKQGESAVSDVRLRGSNWRWIWSCPRHIFRLSPRLETGIASCIEGRETIDGYDRLGCDQRIASRRS